MGTSGGKFFQYHFCASATTQFGLVLFCTSSKAELSTAGRKSHGFAQVESSWIRLNCIVFSVCGFRQHGSCWSGQASASECSSGRPGEAASAKCDCQRGSCWSGQASASECSSGRPGEAASAKCNCQRGSCWSGQASASECSSGRPGEAASAKCGCQRGSCWSGQAASAIRINGLSSRVLQQPRSGGVCCV
jgi:hypothetical protein